MTKPQPAYQHHILVVDDEPDIRKLLVMTLHTMQLSADAAAGLTEARALLKKQDYTLCLTDMNLADGSGIDLVKLVDEQYNSMPIAVITAYGSMETATKAMKAGAYDFIAKPLSLGQLKQLVADGLSLATQHQPVIAESDLIGNSTCIRALRRQIQKLARSQAPVCLLGEPGVGKQKVARLLHRESPRSDRPFIEMNCAALAAEQHADVLFGKLSSANEPQPGRLQQADHGTLFLNNIDQLSFQAQTELARTLQSKVFYHLNDQREQPLTARIVSASSQPLGDAMANQQLQQNLYYRLAVIELNLPPLRDHPEDIGALAYSILNVLCEQWQQPAPLLAETVIPALQRHPYPGNVRELESILERALTLAAGGAIEAHHLQLVAQPVTEPATEQPERRAQQPLTEYLEHIEKQELLRALEVSQWNRTAAAKKLGMTFRSLRYRLSKLGLSANSSKPGDNEQS